MWRQETNAGIEQPMNPGSLVLMVLLPLAIMGLAVCVFLGTKEEGE